MKTFKKSLCLVLALVMVLGVCMVGASAAVTYETYADAAAVSASAYADAINVMTDLGYMQGDEQGFRPEGTLTRAEAAKLVAGVALTPAVAAGLEGKAYNTGFEDVPSSHWAAGYIAFCKNKGIINGKSATEFDPNGKVKGIELAKMLLVTKGYGLNGEFAGEGWDINVWTSALSANLLIPGAVFEAEATRAEAAQYIFSTIKTPNVIYNEKTNVYAADTTFTSPVAVAPVYALVVATSTTDKTLKAGEVYIRLHNNNLSAVGFADAKIKVAGIADADKLIGHEVQVIMNAGKTICYTCKDVTVAASAAEVKAIAAATAGYVVTACFDNYEPADTAAAGSSYLKLATGEYVAMATDFQVAYINLVVEKSDKVPATYANVVYGANPDVDFVQVFDDSFTKDMSTSKPYVKLTNMGNTYAAELLSYKEEVVTYKDSKGNFNHYTKYAGTPNLKSTDAAADLKNSSAAINGTVTVNFLMLDAATYVAALDPVVTAVDNSTYVLFIADYSLSTSSTVDEYGQLVAGIIKNYAQAITADGKIEKYLVQTAVDTDGDALVEGVYTISEKTVKGVAYTEFTKAEKAEEITIGGGTDTSLKLSDTSGKTYYYKNTAVNAFGSNKTNDTDYTKSNLAVIAGAKLADYSENAITAYVVYEENANYTNIRYATTIWFNGQKNAAKAATVANSYIYVVDSTVSATIAEGGKAVNLYKFYVDNAEVKDAKVTSGMSGTGFYTYTLTNGMYALTKVTNFDKVSVGKGGEAYFYESRLTGKGYDETSFAGLTVVDLRAGAATDAQGAITSIDALQTRSLTAAFNITFVTTTAKGKTVPTGVIYVID